MYNKNIYFSPCGFGFWYQLGILNSNNYEEYNLYGSSAGSLICLLSLLDKKDREINNILNECINIKKYIFSKKYSSILNLYNYSYLLSYNIIKKIKNINNIIIKKRLSKIYIEVTEIKFLYNIIPYITSYFINPKNLSELQELIICSCYIPILSYSNNIFYYKFNNKYYIDGFFGKNFNINNSKIIKINCTKYSLIIPCDEKKALDLYNKGLKYNFNTNNNENFILFIIYIIWNNFITLLYLLYSLFFSIN